MEKRPYTEVVHLTGLLLDGEATPEQVDRLQGLLRESPVARFAYRATIQLHTVLPIGLKGNSRELLTSTAMEEEEGVAIATASPAASPKQPARSLSRIKIAIAAGVVILLSCAIGFIVRQPAEETVEGVPVEVLRADLAVLYPNVPVRAGDTISGRDVHLAHGFLELDPPNSVNVSVTAPARIVLKKNYPVIVKSGLVNFVCEDPASECCVETRDAVIRVDSARFGLDVDARTGETSVAVFQGSLEVTHPRMAGDDHAKWVLLPGDSSRFSQGRRLGKMPVVVRQETGANLLRSSDCTIVSEISEFPANDTESRSYVIIVEGMKERRMPFIDRPNVGWAPANQNGFPTDIYGADLVKTYQKDRWKRNFSLTMTFEQPAEVFVLLDIKATPPDWLKRDFKKTGDQLRATPVEKRDAPFGTRYDIWKRTVQPGTITLGRPYPLTQKHVTSMYGVAYRALGPIRPKVAANILQ